jgi:isoleucyl-tRNA synthetase
VAFRAACREYAATQVARQKEDFIRLGVFGDWEHPYLTMDPQTEAGIIRALGEVYAKGYLYQGLMPVYWCADCGSALAEAEVEYEDKTSPTIDVLFPVVDAAAFGERCGVSADGAPGIVIWTTTPWTLPANRAVALHPDLAYVVARVERDGEVLLLLLAEALADACLSRYGFAGAQIVGRCTGRDLEGLALRHPFEDFQVPVILGDHVTTEAGTGAVHTAPGHGQEDFIVGRNYDLEVANPVGDDGRFTEAAPRFAGLKVFDANDAVIDTLREAGTLLHAGRLEHSYPHCWRHKTPVIFRATRQWFISMDSTGLRQAALEEIARTRWLPEWGEARIRGMVENRPDWCVSRQRSWGTPLTLFVHRETGEPHPESVRLIEEVARRAAEGAGVEAWFGLDPEDLLGSEAAEYRKVSDILDVWFDSGVTHACVLDQRAELGRPAQLYLEGSDQHRGWFQSSLLSSVAMRGKAPYEAVLTHGFTVDARGHKMSKSRGNVVAPQKVIKSLGADVLRLWVAATDYRGEMSISDEILKRTADTYRRLRNTARFLLGNLHGFDPGQHSVSVDELVEIERWALVRTADVQAQVCEAYDSYNFHRVYQLMHQFCIVDMGGFYLDVLKDRLYTAPTNSHARRSAQTAMFHILEAMTRWLAPVLSFTADEIWQHMPGQRGESVFLETWYQAPLPADAEALRADWATVQSVREVLAGPLEALRNQGTIGSSLDADVDLYCEADTFRTLLRIEPELRFAFITSTACLHRYEDRPPEAGLHDGWNPASEEKLASVVRASAAAKCVRCWHRREDVGQDAGHPELCSRCVSNVDGPGEQRRFA